MPRRAVTRGFELPFIGGADNLSVRAKEYGERIATPKIDAEVGGEGHVDVELANVYVDEVEGVCRECPD